MNATTRPKRRRYLVDNQLQGRLILHSLVHGLLVILLMCSGVFVPVLWQLGAPAEGASYEAAAVMLYMHENFWPIVVVGAVLVIVTSVRFSHRIAGPLVRYKRNLRLIAEGRLPTKLRTRDGDLLAEEVDLLNSAVVGIGDRVDAIRGAQLALRRELTIALDEATGEQRARLQQLVDACDTLELAVRGFRHVDPGDDLKAAPVAEPVGATQQC